MRCWGSDEVSGQEGVGEFTGEGRGKIKKKKT